MSLMFKTWLEAPFALASYGTGRLQVMLEEGSVPPEPLSAEEEGVRAIRWSLVTSVYISTLMSEEK